jgi:hypothetical protein
VNASSEFPELPRPLFTGLSRSSKSPLKNRTAAEDSFSRGGPSFQIRFPFTENGDRFQICPHFSLIVRAFEAGYCMLAFKRVINRRVSVAGDIAMQGDVTAARPQMGKVFMGKVFIDRSALIPYSKMQLYILTIQVVSEKDIEIKSRLSRCLLIVPTVR